MRLDELSPTLLAATGNGEFGVPRSFSLSRDGRVVLFLRSAGPRDAANSLWVVRSDAEGWAPERLLFEASSPLPGSTSDLAGSLRERTREQASGITRFTHDNWANRVVFELSGATWLCSSETGACRRLAGLEQVGMPYLSPDGTKLAVVSLAGVVVYALTDGEAAATLASIAAEENIELGSPDFIAAEELNRLNGLWWSPDSQQLLIEATDIQEVPRWTITNPALPSSPARRVPYPVAGGSNPHISLRLLNCGSASWTEIAWSHDEYPYLRDVVWTAEGGLTVDLQTRDQKRVTTFSYDFAQERLVEPAAITDDFWVEVSNGTRAHGPGGELCRVLDRENVRTLVIGDVEAKLPAGVGVVHFLARIADGCLVQVASHPTERAVLLVEWDGSVTPLGDRGNITTAWGGGDTVVLQVRSLDMTTPTSYLINRGSMRSEETHGARTRTSISNASMYYEWEENIELVDIGQISSALLLPSWYQAGMKPLPVLIDSYGGPLVSRVLKDRGRYLAARWFAEQGFAVLTTDGVGAPGRSPDWERQLAGDFSRALASQLTALDSALEETDSLDPSRVAIRGWSFGGYLAALAAIRAPERFRAAVAGAPVTDWMLYDTHYTERYLGLGDELEKRAQDLALDRVLEAALAERGHAIPPLMLLHGLSDDNVFAAHSVRFSEALISAGVSHVALFPSSLTHVTRGNIGARLMELESAFLAQYLQPVRPA